MHKSLAGVPVWAWLLLAAAGAGLGLYLRRRHAEQAAAANQPPDASQPLIAWPSSGSGVGTDPGSLTGTSGGAGGGVPPVVTDGGHIPVDQPVPHKKPGGPHIPPWVGPPIHRPPAGTPAKLASHYVSAGGAVAL